MNAQTLIKELRAAGLRQQQIADLTGLSQGYVCDLEKGRHGKRVGYETFRRISDLHLRYFSLVDKREKSRSIQETKEEPQHR